MKIKEIVKKNKRGGASMFVVMFTVIILSIITLSFTRLILSESMKTSNTDLSQSAYDSALAGIEDAKIALLRYHNCLDQGYTRYSGGTCGEIIKNMQDGIANEDCSTVQKVLGREQTDEQHSVVVQETQNSTDSGNNTNMLQAYTCVTIKEDLDDYRTTLNDNNRLRIIPIRSEHIDEIGYVRLRWFSQVNYFRANKDMRWCPSNFFASGSCSGSLQAPTTLSTRIIQTDTTFNLSELSASSAANQTNLGTIFLVPQQGTSANKIVASEWGDAANKAENNPKNVNCQIGLEWFCTVDIELPKTFRGNNGKNDANTYLIVSLPYGSPETDISVQTFNRSGISDANRYDFTGVQARVDSTGRANDLYRRIETRVELVDIYYPYPEFEINMTGNDSLFDKTFYVTFDCVKANDGGSEGCPNSYDDAYLSNI